MAENDTDFVVTGMRMIEEMGDRVNRIIPDAAVTVVKII